MQLYAFARHHQGRCANKVKPTKLSWPFQTTHQTHTQEGETHTRKKYEGVGMQVRQKRFVKAAVYSLKSWLCLLAPRACSSQLHGVPAWFHRACATPFAVSLTLHYCHYQISPPGAADWTSTLCSPPCLSLSLLLSRSCASQGRTKHSRALPAKSVSLNYHIHVHCAYKPMHRA